MARAVFDRMKRLPQSPGTGDGLADDTRFDSTLEKARFGIPKRVELVP